MEYIKQWALGLVLTSVLGTVVLVLAPSGSVEKQVRLAVSLVLLIMFVRPLVGLFDIDTKDFKKDAVITEDTSHRADEYFITAFKSELNNRIMKLIEDNGIEVIKTETDVSVNDEKEVSIVGVVVFITSADEVSAVKDLIKNEYGIIAEVEVRG